MNFRVRLHFAELLIFLKRALKTSLVFDILAILVKTGNNPFWSKTPLFGVKTDISVPKLPSLAGEVWQKFKMYFYPEPGRQF